MKRTSQEKVRIAETLIGKPFVSLPGHPPEWQTITTTKEGIELRVAVIEQVFNDALLMDAIEGPGTFHQTAGPLEQIALTAALQAYNTTLENALTIWLKLPNTRRPHTWGTTPA